MKTIIVLFMLSLLSFTAKGQRTTTSQNYVLATTYTDAKGAAFVMDVKYYDGLGYLIQTVNVGASPIGLKSIVLPTHYDALRRESRGYLPYVASVGSAEYDGSAISGINNQKNFYDNVYNGGSFSTSDAQQAYTESVYDASPLDRVVQAYNVGSVFRTNDKKSSFDYTANTSGDNIKRFRVNRTILSNGDISQSISYTTPHPANALRKRAVTNEDGTTSFTFTNALEQTVLERIVADGTTGNIDTYYVYDDYGNLCYVLTPEWSTNPSVAAADMNKFAYTYVYDNRHRCVEKRLPGSEPVYMVYDRGDRLVLTQDGNMRPDNKWVYTKYDNLNRIVSQSVVVGTSNRATIQSVFNIASYDILNAGFSKVSVLMENKYGK